MNNVVYTTHKLFIITGQRRKTPSNEKGSTCSRVLIPASGWHNAKNRCWCVSGFFDKMPFLTDKKRFFLSWIATNTDAATTLVKICYFCESNDFLSKNWSGWKCACPLLTTCLPNKFRNETTYPFLTSKPLWSCFGFDFQFVHSLFQKLGFRYGRNPTS